jgi:hypothetical protein
VFDQRAGGGESVQVAGLGQDRGGADGARPLMEQPRPVSWSSSRTATMRAAVSARRVWACCQSSRISLIRSKAPGRCAITPAGSLNAVTRFRTIRSVGFCPPRVTMTARTARSKRARPRRRVRASSPPRSTITLNAAIHVLDRNGCRGGVQRGRPEAFEQVTHLLKPACDLGQQLLTAGAEVAQPPPGFVDRFGFLAA